MKFSMAQPRESHSSISTRAKPAACPTVQRVWQTAGAACSVVTDGGVPSADGDACYPGCDRFRPKSGSVTHMSRYGGRRGRKRGLAGKNKMMCRSISLSISVPVVSLPRSAHLSSVLYLAAALASAPS